METTRTKLIAEYIVFKNKVSIISFSKECGLSKQTIYRALAGRNISKLSTLKILRFFCYLQQKKH